MGARTPGVGMALLAGRRLDRRLPWPGDDPRFTWARPWWDRRADRRERLVATGAELKRRAQRNRHADSGKHGHDLFVVARLPPHLAPPAQEVPDLLDRPVADRDRRLTRGQLEVGEAAAADAEENADIGPVGGDDISVRRQW